MRRIRTLSRSGKERGGILSKTERKSKKCSSSDAAIAYNSQDVPEQPRMNDFLAAVAIAIASLLAQFIAGCLVAVPLYRSRTGKALEARFRERKPAAFPLIAAAALCGLVLPSGGFGLLPVAAALSALGAGTPVVISFMVSNSIFNMRAPFADPVFTWANGYPRILLAFLAATAAGLLLSRGGGRGLLRDLSVPEGLGARAALRYLGRNLERLWIFILAGAALDAAFRRWGLSALVAFLFTNPATSFLPSFFAEKNVTNPFFLLATRLIETLTDFGGLCALAAIFRPRAMALYFGFLGAAAILLGSSAFFQ
jgi:hypothetical protein